MRVRQAGAASSQRELELELHRLVLRVRLYETHLPYTEPNTSREATARTGRGGRGGPGGAGCCGWPSRHSKANEHSDGEDARLLCWSKKKFNKYVQINAR